MDFAAQEEGHEIGIAERMCILPMRIRERLGRDKDKRNVLVTRRIDIR